MRRIIQKPRTLGALIAVVVLVGGISAAQAALTTGGCLAQKRKAWSNLRKCQGSEEAKQLQGKTADLAKCQTKFDDTLAKISDKAAATPVACRYGDNGNGTVTDYDTGLQWEQKTDDGTTVHDKDNTYSWCVGVFPSCSNPPSPPSGTAFTDFLGTLNNGTSGDGSTTSGCFAGHCDWRLPAIEELRQSSWSRFLAGRVRASTPCSGRRWPAATGRPVRSTAPRASRGASSSLMAPRATSERATSPCSFGECGWACDSSLES